MQKNLIFTFIGNDKPGLIEDISKTVADNDGNWLESQMSQMAGKFAGIIRLSCPQNKFDDLTSAITALNSRGLKIIIDSNIDCKPKPSCKTLDLSIIGLDRPGILHEVTLALAERAINVTIMTTGLSNAPMTGEALFNANAEIEIPAEVDIDELNNQLESIANELTVDISLEEPE